MTPRNKFTLLILLYFIPLHTIALVALVVKLLTSYDLTRTKPVIKFIAPLTKAFDKYKAIRLSETIRNPKL